MSIALSSELFVKSDGSLVGEDDVIKNPPLGRTFRRIAADPHAFYNGTLAEDVVADIQDRGQHHTPTLC